MPIDTYKELVSSIAGELEQAFGANLLGVIQIGSLAHGGFSESYSDIDVAFVLEKPAPDAVVTELIERLKNSGRQGAERLSIFYTTPDFSWGRLRPIDQIDLVDAGCLISGKIPTLPRPSKETVQADLAEHSLPYWQQKTEGFAGDVEVTEANVKEFLRCLIYPARLIYTWQTGKLASNDAAAEHLSQQSPPGVSLEPVEQAVACRNGRLPWSALVKHRSVLAGQRTATLDFLGIPLAPAVGHAPNEQG